MSFGITASYNSVPIIQPLTSTLTIKPVGGTNPIDISSITLPNIRGRLMIVGESEDNNFQWSFQINGGYGSFPSQFSQNFVPIFKSNVNCTITEINTNIVDIETPVADAGGRVYRFTFIPLQSYSGNVRQTSGNVIGNNNFILKITKYTLVQ